MKNFRIINQSTWMSGQVIDHAKQEKGPRTIAYYVISDGSTTDFGHK